MMEPVIVFDAEISSAPATVTVFDDRLEWASVSGGVSATKITAGVLTAGLSLLATGVGKEGYSGRKIHDGGFLYLKDVTGIATTRAGQGSQISITTPSVSLYVQVPRRVASGVTQDLEALVHAAKRSPQNSYRAQQESAGASNSVAHAQIQALSNPETATALANLERLLYTRVISQSEFQAAKDRLFNPEQ